MSDVPESGKLVVGKEPCTFGEVCDVLYSNGLDGGLIPKFREIASSLKNTDDDILTWSSLHRIGGTSTYEILYKILQVWQRRDSDNATLETLSNVLTNVGLKHCSDALRTRFNLDAISCTMNNETNPDPLNLDQQISSSSETTNVTNTVVDMEGTNSNYLIDTQPIVDSSLIKEVADKTSITVLKRINLAWQTAHLKTLLACICLFVLSVCFFALSHALSKARHGFQSLKSTPNSTASWHMYVDSYLMYESKMKDVASNDVVYLHVSLKNPEDWVDSYVMLKAQHITEITFDGSASLTAIFQILKQLSKTVEGIILLGVNENSPASLCDNFNDHDISFLISEKMIIMESVRKLHLNIPFCDGIVKFLEKYTTFPSVTEFQFYLDKEWFSFVKTVFLSSKHSLQSVTINGLLSFEIFQDYTYNLPKLNSVTNLTLRGADLPFKTNLSEFDTVHLFDSVFPEVVHLEVEDAILPLDQFKGLGELQSSLVTAKIGISVDKMIFDLNTIPRGIIEMILYLRFVSCGSLGNVPTLQGLTPENSTVIISSNCKTIAEENTNFIYYPR